MTRAWLLLGSCLAIACGGSSEADGAKSKKDAGSDASGGGGAAGGGGMAGSAATGGGGAAGTSNIDAGTGGAAGQPGGCALPPVAPGTSEIKITSSGVERSARLVVPAGYDSTKKTPLIMVFHGYTETAEQIEKISQMTPAAAKQGVLVVYPTGISTSWNAGSCCGSGSSSNRPDVKFVGDLLDSLQQQLCIDEKRVYAAGFSNGGMLSNRLACELSDRIAAIGPVAGPLAIDPCEPKRPMPVIAFHGTSDFIVPYNGGGLSGAKSAPATFDFWAKNANCTDAPAKVYENGDSSCVQHTQCAAGAIVELCTVQSGGHQWPGGTSAGPAGKLTQDIDASEEMVKFFLAHPMP